jgi:hypothetical protein
MSRVLNHARHNKSVSEHLYNSGSDFGDWVITTAYYSAIYFVSHLLFPNQYEINGKVKRYDSFEDYYREFRRLNQGVELNPHKIRLQLVEEYIPEIYVPYKTLKDECWTSRYVDYIFNSRQVDICKACLQEIEDVCSNSSLE